MWQPKGEAGTIKVKTNPGRKRINILGAISFEDLSVISTLTEDSCDSDKIIEFLQKIRNRIDELKIVVVLDNAKYNLANNTRYFAKSLKIKLLFLPSYSPNLNLIERLWKFTKKKLVSNEYYEHFEMFKLETEKFFDNLDKYSVELKKLLSKKFEIIKLD